MSKKGSVDVKKGMVVTGIEQDGKKVKGTVYKVDRTKKFVRIEAKNGNRYKIKFSDIETDGGSKKSKDEPTSKKKGKKDKKGKKSKKTSRRNKDEEEEDEESEESEEDDEESEEEEDEESEDEEEEDEESEEDDEEEEEKKGKKGKKGKKDKAEKKGKAGKKGAFGGYGVNFKGRKETLEQVFGKKPVPPAQMTKIIWDFVKKHKLGGKKK
jgi:hypothetical protein